MVMAEHAQEGGAGRAPMFSVREAFGWLSEGVLSGRGDEVISGVSIDSRRCEPGDLYVALRGERFDGHEFVADVVAHGVRAVVVERRLPALERVAPPVAALIVADGREALGRIAGGWRNRFGLPLIAVTGSNGKTTVKEMIAAILRAHVGDDAALATRGNLNNDVGVPQTLLGLHAGHRAAVVELGMNHPGEIAWLAALSRPTVALVNNAQREHQEFLSGAAATAHENGAVFGALAADGVAVFPGDDECAPIWRELAGARPVLAFGLDPHRFEVAAVPDATPARFEMRIGADHVTVALAIAGRHNVRNALAAAACCQAIGVPAATIAAGLGRFTPASGRLQRRRGPGGVTLIDDSYNANPDSVRAAIDLLADEPGPRMLILGDMGEVGAQGPAFHREVGEYARDRAIDELCAVGPASADTARGFGGPGHHFPSVEALLAAFAVDGEALLRGAATVLVKGSRFMRMERVVRALAGETAGVEVAH
jgi:UDP-N-acetylmuramoyl-tripeptide--D-alanyl-D-alanine ligase